jgi:hypothetical protein
VPTDRERVFLTQKEGFLCDLLLNLSIGEQEAAGRVNYPLVLQRLTNQTEDPALLDYELLAKDILNGEVTDSSIQVLEPLSVFLEDIPPGYWVGERITDGAFWSQLGDGGVGLLLSSGLHCFLNKEDGLLLKVFVDIQERTSFSSLHEAQLW